MKIKKVKLNENFLSVPIAHRGLHSKDICENSMKSFMLAKEKKVAIEIDIHCLTDGKFAVFHDKNLKRITGNDIMISTLSSSELSNYKLWDGQSIPLLEDVLNEISGEVPLLIELKPENGFKNKDVKPFLEILKTYNHNDMVALQTFNPFLIKELKKQTSDFAVGILSSHELGKMSKIKNFFYRTVPLFEIFDFDFVSYDIRFLPNKTIDNLKKKNYQLLAWCIDSNEKLEKAKVLADNIIFEKLDVSDSLYFNKQ